VNDTLKDTALALFGLWLFNWVLTDRVEHAARRDLRAAIPNGRIDARVESRGLYGMVVGRAWRATISGGGFTTDTLPFRLEPGGGTRASVRHLTLDLHDIVVRDLPIRTLRADIPFVELDGTRVLFSGHVSLRAAGEGRGEAVLTAEGLTRFLSKQRPQFRNLEIRLVPGEARVRAETTFLAASSLVEGRAKIAIAAGRRLNAVDAKITLGGRELSAPLTETLLRTLNPIIDIERDLGLGDWLYVTDAEIGDGILTVRARVTLPRADRGDAKEGATYGSMGVGELKPRPYSCTLSMEKR